MSLAERLHLAMQRAPGGQMKAIELARQANLTRSAISFLLDGTTKTLRSESAAGIARALNISITWLIEGKGEMRPEESVPARITEASPVYDVFNGVSEEVRDAITRILSVVKKSAGKYDNAVIAFAMTLERMIKLR